MVFHLEKKGVLRETFAGGAGKGHAAAALAQTGRPT
jgi:hypothetical protein